MLEGACESQAGGTGCIRRYGMVGQDAYSRVHPDSPRDMRSIGGPRPGDAS
jgi:hypothetical protein